MKDRFDSNSQEPDTVPHYDRDQRIGGKGQMGGGSKSTPQRSLTTTGNSRGGSYPLKGSFPKHPQKIRT